MEWIDTHLFAYLGEAAKVVATASVIANFTKTDTDNRIVAFIGKLIDFLAINWLNKDKK